MATHKYHLFETAHGRVAIGWNARGVTSFRLPGSSAEEARRSLLRRLPGAVEADPPERVAALVQSIRRYFAGEQIDFSDVPLDLGRQEPLFERIYDLVRRLGWGETTTYGAIAKALGEGPEVARDVGQAMARNPIPLIVPCHRVLAAGGRIGGFSAPGGSDAKARMLALEGVQPGPAEAVSASAQTSFGF
jgi:methylated-DNA-[protein]-cysteine S-methyltransferase